MHNKQQFFAAEKRISTGSLKCTYASERRTHVTLSVSGLESVARNHALPSVHP
jgi:hypothetical protein